VAEKLATELGGMDYEVPTKYGEGLVELFVRAAREAFKKFRQIREISIMTNRKLKSLKRKPQKRKRNHGFDALGLKRDFKPSSFCTFPSNPLPVKLSRSSLLSSIPSYLTYPNNT
jgi:hypothetical protein